MPKPASGGGRPTRNTRDKVTSREQTPLPPGRTFAPPEGENIFSYVAASVVNKKK